MASKISYCALMIIVIWTTKAAAQEAVVVVKDSQELQDAVAQAKPGTKILMAPGSYPGGLYFRDMKGEPGKPIPFRTHSPTLNGHSGSGSTSLHLHFISNASRATSC